MPRRLLVCAKCHWCHELVPAPGLASWKCFNPECQSTDFVEVDIDDSDPLRDATMWPIRWPPDPDPEITRRDMREALRRLR
jgi:hypothetical protein